MDVTLPPHHKTLELKGVPHALVLKILRILRDCGALHENGTKFDTSHLSKVVVEVYGDLLKKHNVCSHEISVIINQTIQDCYRAGIIEMEEGQIRTIGHFDSRAEAAIKEQLSKEDIILICERARRAVQVFRS